jgi:hypothetical protein
MPLDRGRSRHRGDRRWKRCLERQNEVAAAVRASVAEIAGVVVVALRAATPELAEWDVVDDATWVAPGPAGSAQPPPHPAWVAAVKASGGPPPRPQAQVSASPKEPPPPPPGRGGTDVPPPPPVGPCTGTPSAAAAQAAVPSKAPGGPGLAETQANRDWEQRLAVAAEHGAAVAESHARGEPAPSAPPHAPPLRSRLWVAVHGLAESAGLYGRWENGAEVARRDGHTVLGYPSLAEAKAFMQGAAVEVPDGRF